MRAAAEGGAGFAEHARKLLTGPQCKALDETSARAGGEGGLGCTFGETRKVHQHWEQTGHVGRLKVVAYDYGQSIPLQGGGEEINQCMIISLAAHFVLTRDAPEGAERDAEVLSEAGRIRNQMKVDAAEAMERLGDLPETFSETHGEVWATAHDLVQQDHDHDAAIYRLFPQEEWKDKRVAVLLVRNGVASIDLIVGEGQVLPQNLGLLHLLLELRERVRGGEV